MTQEHAIDETDLLDLTLASVQEGFASGRFTSESLVRASLQQIQKYNDFYKPSSS